MIQGPPYELPHWRLRYCNSRLGKLRPTSRGLIGCDPCTRRQAPQAEETPNRRCWPTDGRWPALSHRALQTLDAGQPVAVCRCVRGQRPGTGTATAFCRQRHRRWCRRARLDEQAAAATGRNRRFRPQPGQAPVRAQEATKTRNTKQEPQNRNPKTERHHGRVRPMPSSCRLVGLAAAWTSPGQSGQRGEAQLCWHAPADNRGKGTTCAATSPTLSGWCASPQQTDRVALRVSS